MLAVSTSVALPLQYAQFFGREDMRVQLDAISRADDPCVIRAQQFKDWDCPAQQSDRASTTDIERACRVFGDAGRSR
jgi:hypothetical protein